MGCSGSKERRDEKRIPVNGRRSLSLAAQTGPRLAGRRGQTGTPGNPNLKIRPVGQNRGANRNAVANRAGQKVNMPINPTPKANNIGLTRNKVNGVGDQTTTKPIIRKPAPQSGTSPAGAVPLFIPKSNTVENNVQGPHPSSAPAMPAKNTAEQGVTSPEVVGSSLPPDANLASPNLESEELEGLKNPKTQDVKDLGSAVLRHSTLAGGPPMNKPTGISDQSLELPQQKDQVGSPTSVPEVPIGENRLEDEISPQKEVSPIDPLVQPPTAPKAQLPPGNRLEPSTGPRTAGPPSVSKIVVMRESRAHSSAGPRSKRMLRSGSRAQSSKRMLRSGSRARTSSGSKRMSRSGSRARSSKRMSRSRSRARSSKRLSRSRSRARSSRGSRSRPSLAIGIRRRSSLGLRGRSSNKRQVQSPNLRMEQDGQPSLTTPRIIKSPVINQPKRSSTTQMDPRLRLVRKRNINGSLELEQQQFFYPAKPVATTAVGQIPWQQIPPWLSSTVSGNSFQSTMSMSSRGSYARAGGPSAAPSEMSGFTVPVTYMNAQPNQILLPIQYPQSNFRPRLIPPVQYIQPNRAPSSRLFFPNPPPPPPPPYLMGYGPPNQYASPNLRNVRGRSCGQYLNNDQPKQCTIFRHHEDFLIPSTGSSATSLLNRFP